MEIIVRAAGERTEEECIRLASRHGNVHVIRARPFGAAVRLTYLHAMDFDQKWTPVIDADVLLFDGSIEDGLEELESREDNERIFCLDGYTDDKTLFMRRRAGIHIYNNSLLDKALQFVDSDQLKPESHVRRQMDRMGYPTYSGTVLFGLHDYFQWYRDLWRKAVVQAKKLEGFFRRDPSIVERWTEYMAYDKDFLVIFCAHQHGLTMKDGFYIDVEKDYSADYYIEKLGLKEKEPKVIHEGVPV